MLRPRRGQSGLGLVELMIATTIGLVALAAIVSVYSSTAQQGSGLLRAMHLQQQLYGVADLIAADIRRAGYWQFDPRLRSPDENPFQPEGHPVRIGALEGEADASCILLAYDLDDDGAVGVGRCGPGGCAAATDGDNVEQFGYRLRQGSIQSRYAGTDFDCNSGYWQAVTDPGIEITRLHFREHSRCVDLLDGNARCRPQGPRLTRFAIAVGISGHNRGRREENIGLSRWVHVRNAHIGRSLSP